MSGHIHSVGVLPRILRVCQSACICVERELLRAVGKQQHGYKSVRRNCEAVRKQQHGCKSVRRNCTEGTYKPLAGCLILSVGGVVDPISVVGWLVRKWIE